MDNCWEYAVIVYAISKAGAITVPINNTFKSKELSYILNDADIKFIFAHDYYKDIIDKSIALHCCNNIVWVGKSIYGTNFTDILKSKLESKNINLAKPKNSLIVYTSGTTGKPKGAIITAKNLESICRVVSKHINLQYKDKVVLFLPLYHSFSLILSLLFPINSANTVVLHRYKNAKSFLEYCAQKRVTILLATPIVYKAIAQCKSNWLIDTFNSFRLFVSGTYPIDAQTIKDIKNKFKRAKFIEAYGLSESSAVVSANPLDNQKIGSVGIPLYDVKIIDSYDLELPRNVVGEIIVSGDNIMNSYLNSSIENPCSLKRGWLYTGDLGYLDEDGYLFITGRKKDLILSNGEHIYPKEIEDVINNFDGVEESAVVAKKDPLYYEVAVAFLKTRASNTINIENLKTYLKGFLSDNKIPKEFIIVDEFPRNGAGKILKNRLREMAQEPSLELS
jgi:long-chain acyl-CoA synthetase